MRSSPVLPSGLAGATPATAVGVGVVFQQGEEAGALEQLDPPQDLRGQLDVGHVHPAEAAAAGAAESMKSAAVSITQATAWAWSRRSAQVIPGRPSSCG